MWWSSPRRLAKALASFRATFFGPEVFVIALYFFEVVFSHLFGLEAEFFAGFHVYEFVGTIFKLELQFVFFVGNVEEYYFVLVVAQMLQGAKQGIFVLALLKHVGEDHHERALVDAVCDLVEGCSGCRAPVHFGLVYVLLQIAQQQAVMGGAGFATRVQANFFIEKA